MHHKMKLKKEPMGLTLKILVKTQAEAKTLYLTTNLGKKNDDVTIEEEKESDLKRNESKDPKEKDKSSQEKAKDKNRDKDDKDRDKDKDKRKEKKKKKSKKNKKHKKHKKDAGSDSEDDKKEKTAEGDAPRKKIKSGVYESKTIPEHLKDHFAEIEENPLKLIIGNIPMNMTRDELKQYFHTLLVSLNPQLRHTPPIVSFEIGETKNYAVAELFNKDVVKLCLSMDVLELQGYKISIQKPKGFFEKLYDSIAANEDMFGNISTNAVEQDHKIYMGSIPLYLKEEDVRKICESFGMLKYFNLVKDTSSGQPVSKGYCFFEYLDPKATEKAVKGLNNLEIGDKRLKVQRASTGTKTKDVGGPITVAETAEKEKKQASNAGGSYLASYPNIKDIQIQAMLNAPLFSITPSRVIQIMNVITIEDLWEDDLYEELIKDMKEECEKFGPVEKIDVPRPDPKTGIVGPNVGKVFVKFAYLIPAKQARYRLAGRTYNRRTVITSFYPEDKFDAKDYITNV